MITTLQKSSPLASQRQGNVTIAVQVESDNEPVNFEDSFVFKVNNLDVTTFSTSKVDDLWTISFTTYLFGPQTVTIFFSCEDNDEEKEGLFTFSMLTERVLGTNRDRYSPYTDELSAYLPEYTKARNTTASLFKQIMNPLGTKLDEVKLGALVQNKGLNINKTVWNDPDWVEAYSLEEGEKFKKAAQPSGNIGYTSPKVLRYKNFNKLKLTEAKDFRDFWTGMPIRYHTIDLGECNPRLTPSISIFSLQDIANIEVPVPGEIYLELHSGKNLVALNDNIIPTEVILKGYSPADNPQSEKIPLSLNGLYTTSKAWKKISSMHSNLANENTEGEIILHNFPPERCTKVDPYFKLRGEPIYWDAGNQENILGLVCKTPVAGFIKDVLSGESTREAFKAKRLAGTDGVQTLITDFAIDPTTYYLYGISSSNLFIWDRRDFLPLNMELLNESSERPEVDLHIERIIFDEEDEAGFVVDSISIEVEVGRPRGERLIKRWYYALYNESGQKKYLTTNSTFSGSSPTWRYNPEPNLSYGMPNERRFSAILSDNNSIIIELFVEFIDGTTEVIRKVVFAHLEAAVARYIIPTQVSGFSRRVAVRSDGTIFVLSGGKCWMFLPQYDKFICDYNSNQILVRDQSDFIEVDFND